MGAPRPATAGVCLLGTATGLGDVGPRHVSAAVRHREQLPPIAPGSDSHDHARPLGATAVRRAGVDPAQRVGVVTLGGLGASPPGRPTRRPAAVALPRPVELVGPSVRDALGLPGRAAIGTPAVGMSCFVCHTTDTWIY